ncbi:MAG: protein kinase [Myxococcales bacterium]|nr:protein kinase [Myxococcales bacterium]
MPPPRPLPTEPAPVPKMIAHGTGSPATIAETASPELGAMAMRLPSVGEQFDKYTLLAKLATGGMAELFVAELSGAAGFSKKVVIKRILPHVAHEEHFTRMFLDEAMTCAQISHPNVCQVFELCETKGSHFLVLEHLEGATVGELIRRCLISEQQLNMRLAAGIIVQACDGLHAAHEQVHDGRNSNLVHRDVSPGNLYVTVDGIVKVLDFGIAKARWMPRMTKTGTLLGKCEYMSPEQARGGTTLDRRSDIFSLGIIAWELFCGQRLFRRDSEYDTLRAVLRAPIDRPRTLRPSIPEALDEAIMRAVERDVDDRYRTTYEFMQAIAHALRDAGGPTPMCDIAPLIRSSFAEELKIQRAVLSQASQAGSASQILAPAAMAMVGNGGEDFANTDLLTSELLRPSALADESEDSAELTFRDVPQEPAAVRRPSHAPSSPVGASASAAGPSTSEIPEVSRLPSANADAAESPTVDAKPSGRRKSRLSSPPAPTSQDSTPTSAVVTPVLSELSGPVRTRGRTALLLSLTLLLGAAVTTGSLAYFGSRARAKSRAAKATQRSLEVPAARVIAPPSTAPAPHADAAPHTTDAPVLSATANAAAQAELLEANRQAEAIVTALPVAKEPDSSPATGEPDGTLGTVEIHSSEAGQVYLYPKKKLLGTTPLAVNLPPGRYKLKLQVGSEKGQKKYFHIRVKTDAKTRRSFDHW